MNLTTATPAEIDTALAEVWERYYRAAHRVQTTLADVKRFRTLDARQPGLYARTLANLEESLESAREAARAIAAETVPFDAEFDRRGGWTRAWKVTNSNGHVHASRECSTCYASTEFGWLPQVSGLTEAEIVDLAGEAACSVCYPTAPVAPKPCRLFTKGEESAQAERDAKAAAKAEREAKRLAKAILPDGSDLVFERSSGWKDRVRTLVSARSALVDLIEWRTWSPERASTAGIATLAEAIAAKEGKDVETVIAEAEKRAAKRAR